ncbi:dynein axonemal heavy chain 10-like isoform X3 [Oscarella lobularis]|uniref:dynein axonemal heavy chain 10-like isoform X3 n=1 Tax=Oscarella lobularis TaxID=121494 RepID=UPI00331391CA
MRCSGGLHKGIILEKIAAKKLSCVKFDSQLQFYANIAVKESGSGEDFVRIQLEPLTTRIQEHAQAWVTSLCKLLNDSARDALFGLRNQLEGLMNDSKRPPDTLENLN